MYSILIATSVLLFLPTWWYILRRDDLTGIGYAVLFIYTIFTQVGYIYYPGLSAGRYVYYGEEMFLPYWAFMTGSFAACFLGFVVVRRARWGLGLVRLEPVRSPHLFLFYALVLVFTGALVGGYFVLRPELRYGALEEDLTRETIIFLYGFRLYAAIVLALWARKRDPALARPRRGALVLFILSLTAYAAIALAVGSRSDLLYLAFGIAVFELQPLALALRKYARKLIFISLCALPFLYGLLALESARQRYNPITMGILAETMVSSERMFGTEGGMAEQMIGQDYYWPSTLLMTAMYYDVVDPLEVVKSNGANALAGLQYPYLTQTLAAKAVGRMGFGRVGGFAFHLFIEGWMVAGWFGIVYNAVAFNAGLALCRSLTRTSVLSVNRLLTAQMAIVLPSMMRMQSSVFVKVGWTHIPFIVLVVILVSGWKFRGTALGGSGVRTCRPLVERPQA